MPTSPHAGARPSIAIVGAGPSGCYTAQFLRKDWPDAEITVFDRHEEPFGLLRYGVAPDHLGTKALAKQLVRIFDRSGVRFVGGVEVGRTMTLADLRSRYDAVVLATGLWGDRRLPGFHPEESATDPVGLYGAGRITRMINAHPGRESADVRLGERTVIVGLGNVAIDLVRLLLTPPESLTEIGVPDDAVAALGHHETRTIDVVGRSSASEAKFDAAMVRELARFTDVAFTSDMPDAADAADPRVAAVRELTSLPSPAAPARRVRFHFGWTPARLEADHRVRTSVFRDVEGTRRDLRLDTDSVITAVGFTESGQDAVRCSELRSATSDLDRGVLDSGLYSVGWCRRGPVGTIPANRSDAKIVAATITADLVARSSATGSAA